MYLCIFPIFKTFGKRIQKVERTVFLSRKQNRSTGRTRNEQMYF